MKISKKLKELRHQKKLTATYVSTQLGIAKSTLSNYENGTRTPGIQTLGKFAEFYNTTLDYFVNNDFEHLFALQQKHESITIPILGHIETTSSLYPDNSIIGYVDLDSEYAGKGEFFALYVSDDSMNNSRICEGDIVIVRKQPFVENGEIAVVLIENESATIKKIFYKENFISLMPSSCNQAHKVKTINTETTDVNILGKVIEVKIKL